MKSKELKKERLGRGKVYLEGNVAKTLFFNSIPMLIGIGSVIIFNVIDTIFISKLGANYLTAISYSFPIVFFVSSVIMGLGNGVSSLLSKALGAGDKSQSSSLATNSLLMALVIALVFNLLYFTFDSTIYNLLGAGDVYRVLIKQYLDIWIPGATFLSLSMVCNYILRSVGDTKLTGSVMLGSVLLNLAIDPILIFGLGSIEGLGISGAAWASVFARIPAFLVLIYQVNSKYKLLDFSKINIKQFAFSSKQILAIAVPSSISNLLTPISFSILINLAGDFGADAVAGIGGASRFEALMLVVFMAMASVLGPFIGQNYGAKQIGRIEEVLNISRRFSLLWLLFIYPIVLIFGDTIANLISNEKTIVDYINTYFIIVIPSILFKALIIITVSTFNVLGKAVYGTILNVINSLVLFYPLALILKPEFGVEGILLAITISSALVAIFSQIWLRLVVKRL